VHLCRRETPRINSSKCPENPEGPVSGWFCVTGPARPHYLGFYLTVRDTTLSNGIFSANGLRVSVRLMLLFLLIVFLLPFFLLMFYSVPAADDFCKASLSFDCVPQPSVLAITWMYYTRWSPRWVTTLLQSFVMSRGRLLSTYGWLLLLVAVSNLAALWYFFRAVLRTSQLNSLFIGVIVYEAWLVNTPNLDEQVYWLTGAMEYMLPLSSLLVLLGLLARPHKAAWYYVVVALLSIAVPAQHEIAGTFLCAVLFVGAVVLCIKKLPGKHWYLSLCMAWLSYAAGVLSPGNAARAVQEHRKLWDFAHLPHWLGHSFYHGMNWLSAPATLIAAACAVLIVQQDPQFQPGNWRPLDGKLATVSIGAMAFVLFESALIEIATGSWLPPRVVVALAFLFWVLFVCLAVSIAPELYRVSFSMSAKVLVFLLLGVTLLGSQNFRNATEDLRGPAQAWWRAEVTRLSQRGGVLEYEAPAQYPKLAKPQMLGEPSCWVNRCLANYLHAEKVIVTNSHDECPH